MPAPAPTFGNAAGDDLDMPEVGVTVFTWFELVSLFLKTLSIFFSQLFFLVRMCILFKYDVVTLIELVESRPCL